MPRRKLALAASLALASHGALAVDGPLRTYRGAADASAVVRIDGATILVGDDEDNVLRLYDAEAGGPPRQELDVSSFLGLDPDDEADIEAAARIGDRVYWITSHGPSRHRQRFFAIRVENAGDGTLLRPLGRPFDQLLPALRRALAGVLADADLAAVNIEGLASSADGRSLWIGLRAPLVSARAIVLPLANPGAVVEQGSSPELGQPILWDLGQRGVRDLLWSASRKELLVLATSDGASPPVLYRWSGTFGDPPRELGAARPAASAAAADIQPEALVERADGTRILVLSDDGERRVEVPPSECRSRFDARTGTCPNKRLRDPGRKTFRGFDVAR